MDSSFDISSQAIKALSNGDRNAAASFIATYALYVKRIVSNILTDYRDIEETVQDIFVTAIDSILNYDIHKSSIATWLGRISVNKALGRLRYNARRPVHYPITAEILCDNNATFDNSTDTDDTLRSIHRAIDFLQPEDRTLLHLIYFQECSLEDAAIILSATPGALATRLHRLRRRLKTIISNERP